MLVPVVALALLGACGSGQPLLSDDVEILIDDLGVPHIYGATDEDTMLGSGYMMARMRLFQLEMVRRQAYGRQAELLGERAYGSDLGARMFDFAGWGRASRAALRVENPALAQQFEAFVRGINLFIQRVQRGEEKLPAELQATALDHVPEPFSQDDPYVIGKMLSFGMSSSLDFELLMSALGTLAPGIPANFPLTTPTRQAYTMPGALPSTPAAFLRPEPPVADLPELSARQQEQVAQRLHTAAPISPKLGSNNWAVAGRFTASGRSMLAGDPHQPLGNPGRFFVQHLSSLDRGGSLDVIGFGFTGAPGVQLGHTRRVGWTATTNFADVMDMWRVKLSPSGDEANLGGVWKPILSRKEVIRVRLPGGPPATADGRGDARTVTLGEIPGYGVFLPDDLLPVPKFVLAKAGEDVLLNWTGLATTKEAAMYAGLCKSSSLAEWDAAAQTLEVGAVNLIAADANSIQYRVHARVPRRNAVKTGSQPWKILDGSDPKTLWTGEVLGELELPAAKNPDRGYLCTANNDPWGFTGDGRVDNDPFYYSYFFDPGDRAHRIESELKRLIASKPGKLTLDDMRTLQLDAYSAVAEDVIPALKKAVDAIPTDASLVAYRNRPELSALAARLWGWDRQMRRDSTEAVVFFALANFATNRGIGDELGPFMGRLWQVEPAFAYKPLRMALQGHPAAKPLLQQGQNAVLVAALAETYDWLKRRFAIAKPETDTSFSWRQVHGARFDHILGGMWNAGTFPVDGSVGTVNVSSSSMSAEDGRPRDTWTSHDGSLYRMVLGFDPDGTPRAEVNFPRGNDADKDSRFYRNAHPGWLDGKYTALRFKRPEVEAGTVERYVLGRDGQLRK